MGVDTRALLKTNPDPITLMNWADLQGYTEVSLTPARVGGFVWLNFMDKNDSRRVAVFYDNACRGDWEDFYAGDATYISMGCWGNSERIVRSMVRDFGGWFMVNDCEDDWTRLDQ